MKPIAAFAVALLLTADAVREEPFQLEGFQQRVLPFVQRHCASCR